MADIRNTEFALVQSTNMEKYCKNFILCGDVDYHCLICSESFKVSNEVEKHIRWENHRRNVKNQSVLPKHKKDGIYKIREKIYCEFCNYVLHSIDALKSHIAEETHKSNKINPGKATRTSVAVREDNSILLGEKSVPTTKWHGIVDKKCLLCDVEVKAIPMLEHIALSSHMINLIQCPVQIFIFRTPNEYYRKVNSDTFYCFKCNYTFPVNTLESHWSEINHSFPSSHKQMTNNNNLVNRWQCLSTCTICKETVLVDHQFEHQKTHNKDVKQADVYLNLDDKFYHRVHVDYGKRRGELAKYGKENFIKMNKGGSKGYCNICDTELSAHINIFTQHVKGMRHQAQLELNGLSEKQKIHLLRRYETKPLEKFIHSNQICRDHQVMIVNNMYCINISSFAMLKPLYIDDHTKHWVKCFVCDVTLKDHLKCNNLNCASVGCKGTGMDKHFKETNHMKMLMRYNVITSLKGEFIREVKPNLYHCGYCNITVAYWDTLEVHMKSYLHVHNKRHQFTVLVDINESVQVYDIRRAPIELGLNE